MRLWKYIKSLNETLLVAIVFVVIALVSVIVWSVKNEALKQEQQSLQPTATSTNIQISDVGEMTISTTTVEESSNNPLEKNCSYGSKEYSDGFQTEGVASTNLCLPLPDRPDRDGICRGNQPVPTYECQNGEWVILETNAQGKVLSSTDIFPIDERLPEYQAFSDEIESKFCSHDYSEAVYKNCIYDILLAKNKEVEKIFNKLSSELPKIETKLLKNDAEFSYTYGYAELIEILPELYKSSLSYRNTICEASYIDTLGGSGHGGFVTMCKLYETQKLINLLNSFDDGWIKRLYN